VVTHGDDFHADDVFACATLSLWAEKTGNKLKIIRNRKKDIIGKGDIVVDVGGIYDPDKNKFDHHQKGRAGAHDGGIPYASFGLVWKKYGEMVSGGKEIADKIEKNLVVPIDARDNGINISKINELGIVDHRTSDMICNFNLTWSENKNLLFKQFEKALYFAKEILIREVVWTGALIEDGKATETAIREQNEPEILILNKNIEWHEAVSKNQKIKLVIYPRKEESKWCIQVGRDNLQDYNSDRINFPESWHGLKDEELGAVSGIKDAVFCTIGGWFAVAKSKEGAIEMANKTLQN
jgi:uncharacterized UPF0160 family protein